jgi:hypothetical protein
MGHEKYRGGVCGASGQNPSDREGGVPSGERDKSMQELCIIVSNVIAEE